MGHVLFTFASFLCVALTPVAFTGCDKNQPDSDAVVRADAPPTYASVAARYNERIARFEQVWARAVVRLKFTDEKGKVQNEQGEGLLQIVRPDKLALSIKKAGIMAFWFGGDAQRYWLFDVVDEPVVRVGRHDMLARRPKGSGLGIDINPRELIRLLGITPLGTDAKSAGTTAWAKDGKQLTVTTTLADGGKQVILLDPATTVPSRITLQDRAGAPLVTADLELYEPVELVNAGGARPRLPGRITAVHPASKTEIKLDLSEMRNGRVAQVAFDFDELCRQLATERVIDLDAPKPGTPAR